MESQSAECNMPTQEQVIEILKTVEDPELFLDIWFLGLVYRVEVKDSTVEIDMTFTTPLCPAGPALIDEVQTKVNALEGVEETKVQVVFDPPWQASEDVKAMLGMI